MCHAASRKSLPIAIALICEAVWGTASRAQQPEALPEPIRIEVTGSRIARVDAETALPIQIISRDEIQRGNWTTAAELLTYVSANISGANTALSVTTTPLNPGLSSANLRGIGDFNTLVLLNGRRLSNYAFLSATVDLSVIPLAAIDRVEILKDGASSIYGTDAIAGVINFITRKDFAGAEVTGQAAATQHGGGNHYQATGTFGWGDLTRDRFNAFVTFDWQKDTALNASDRAFASTSYIPSEGINRLVRGTFPANIIGPTGVVNPSRATGCQPPNALVVPGTTGCWYDPVASAHLLPEQELWNVIGRATWEWTPGHQVFAEYVFSRNQLAVQLFPTVANLMQTFGQPVRYPDGGPYYPTEFAAANGLSGPLTINWRLSPLGSRESTVTTEAQRVAVGAQGTLAGWAYDGAYLHSVNTAENSFTTGYVSTPAFLTALRTGLMNPFGESAEEGMELLRSTQVMGTLRKATGTIDQVDLNVSRDLYRLAAGPLAFALGSEWRREKLTDDPSVLLGNGDVMGIQLEIEPQDASRSVGAAYAEITAPVLAGLELGASVRYDHYSDFGGTTNPKVAARWQPVPTLLLRGTWGTGFRAPALFDLYTPRTYVVRSGFIDPIRCPVTGNDADCGAGEYIYASGGNPDLQPETSDQYSVGGIWEPVPGISIGLQWWQIAKKNFIVWYSPEEVQMRYDALAPRLVIRRLPDPSGLPGPIVAINGAKENAGDLVTSGIDVTLNFRASPTRVGTFRFALTGTYTDRASFDDTGNDSVDVAGRWYYGPAPRWRHYAEFNWQSGPWSATLAQLFQTGYVDQNPNPALPPRDVANYSLWNVQGVYSGWRNWSLAAGVRNLFDTDPPFSNQVATTQFGYDPMYADPRGRTFYARVTYAFK